MTELLDSTLVKLVGGTRTFTVGALRELGYQEHELRVLVDYTPRELRTAASQSAFERELGRRVGAAVRVVSVNEALGQGTYEIVASHGKTVPKNFTFDVSTHAIQTPEFPPAVNAGGADKGKVPAQTPGGPLQARATEGYAPPDPWTPHLAKLKTAETKPNTHTERAEAEAAYRKLRTAEFAAEPGHIAAMRTANGIPEPRTLSAEAGGQYAPPDPWAAGLAAQREKDARILAAKETR